MTELEERNIIQLLRTSGSTVPVEGVIINDNSEVALKGERITIKEGELILAMDNESPRIYFLKNNGEFAEFVDRREIEKNEFIASKAINALKESIQILYEAVGDGFVSGTLTEHVGKLESKHNIKSLETSQVGGLDLFGDQ